MDELLKEFLVETGEHVDAVASELVRFERDPADMRAIANVYRLVHSIKGTCGFLDLPRLEALTHAVEALISRLREGMPASRRDVSLILNAVDRVKAILAGIEATAAEPPGDDSALIAELVRRASGVELRKPDSDLWDGGASAEASQAPSVAGLPERRSDTVRVSVGTLESMISLVSELVLTRNQLVDGARGLENEALSASLQRLSAVTQDLQHGVMKARMQPISRLFASVPRMVRDLCDELGKRAEVTMSGGDTELDRQLIAVVRDPITHIIRNALDHGLERPAQRRVAGKDEMGRIDIRAFHDAGHIAIEISDDGRGVDPAAIRQRVAGAGLAREAEIACLSDEEVLSYIFAPGFSTVFKVTNLSGRGIGLDVVRENIEAVGGTVSCSTKVGAGSRFVLRIPLTLAIAPCLVVAAGGETFALPQDSIVEVHEIGPDPGVELTRAQDATMLTTPRGVMPALDLRRALQLEPASGALHAIVLRVSGAEFALLVEEVAEVMETVVKPIPARLQQLGVYSGNTLLGDGRVMLILDAAGLAAKLGIRRSEGFRPLEAAPKAAGTGRQHVVLFRQGPGPMKVAPASAIAAIETLRPERIERFETGAMLRSAQGLVPLVGPGGTPLRDGFAAGAPVLIVGSDRSHMGVVADDVVDVIEDPLDLAPSGTGGDLVGAGLVGVEAVEAPDLGAWLSRVCGARVEAPRGGPARVHLIDDDPFFRDLLRTILRAAGYDVTSHESADSLCGGGPPPVAVLVDCGLPELDGRAFTARLRSFWPDHHVAVIALGAHASGAARRFAEASGMEAAAGKFDRAGLLATLARAAGLAFSMGEAA